MWRNSCNRTPRPLTLGQMSNMSPSFRNYFLPCLRIQVRPAQPTFCPMSFSGVLVPLIGHREHRYRPRCAGPGSDTEDLGRCFAQLDAGEARLRSTPTNISIGP